MVSSALWTRGIYTIAKLSLIGWTQTFAMARDEMKRFSSARRGAVLQIMIAGGYLKSRNWRPPFVGLRNLHLNHRSKRRPVSRRSARYGPIASWIGFREYSADALLSLPQPS